MPSVFTDFITSAQDAVSTASLVGSTAASVASSTIRATVQPINVVHSSSSAVAPAASIAEAAGEAAHATGAVNSADIVMLLLTLSVVLQVLNFHYFKIPAPVTMAFGAIVMTLVLLILSQFRFLGIDAGVEAFRLLLRDFPDLLLNYMLGFLLFAAAIEVDLPALGRILSTVLALSVVSTLLSTFIVGILTYFLMQNIAHMDLAWCFLFGAIVSPTDPVTVISILNEKPDLLPKSTRYFVLGESLLNDAVGVLCYLVLLEIVQKPDIGFGEVLGLLFETAFVECVYGAAIGVFLAWLAYTLILSVQEPFLEVVITFVLVGNINMLCRILHASIPLASVCAGLFIGNYAVNFAMDDEATDTFHSMWKLADETLNSILFLMIGAACLFWNPQDLGWGRVFILTICTISISFVARFLAVVLPLISIIFIEYLTGRRFRHPSVRYRAGTIAVLTWAGMRGGISIALALGVPDSFVKHAVPGHMTYGQLIFFMTFILVVFSIIVQGLLFEPVVKMINRVSFDMFASGGLGTYVSANNFDTYGEYIDHEDETPEHSIISGGGDQFWQSSIPNVLDSLEEEEIAANNNNNDSNNQYMGPPRVRSENFPERNVLIRRNSDYTPSAPEGMYGAMNYGPPAHDHERQGSITFQNLPHLEKPPSIPMFFGALRRQGTHSFRQWFDQKLASDQNADNHPLRRSKTEPDNARLARGGDANEIR